MTQETYDKLKHDGGGEALCDYCDEETTFKADEDGDLFCVACERMPEIDGDESDASDFESFDEPDEDEEFDDGGEA